LAQTLIGRSVILLRLFQPPRLRTITLPIAMEPSWSLCCAATHMAKMQAN